MSERWVKVLVKALAAASIPIAFAVIDDLVDNGKLDGSNAEWLRRVVSTARKFV